MTPDEIRQLGRGMPLDRLVQGAVSPEYQIHPPPNYSGTGDGWEFWAMLAWAKAKGLHWEMQEYKDEWAAYLWRKGVRPVSATAPTLPHAVALCVALAAAKEGMETPC